MQQRLGSFEVYRQSWRLYRQTRSSYRRLRRLDCVRTTPQQRWSDIKNLCQGRNDINSYRHQHDTLLTLMSMQVMLLRCEGQTEPFDVIQVQIEASQKQLKVLSVLLESLSVQGFYRGVLWLLMLFVSIWGLLKIQPGLSSVLGWIFQLEITRSFAVVVVLIGLAERLRQQAYVGYFSYWVTVFDSKQLEPEEIYQCIFKYHRREITRAAGVCCLVDWFFSITGLSALIVLLRGLSFVLPAPLLYDLLPLGLIAFASVLLWIQERVWEPFRYAVWAVVYSNWRSQYWREG